MFSRVRGGIQWVALALVIAGCLFVSPGDSRWSTPAQTQLSPQSITLSPTRNAVSVAPAEPVRPTATIGAWPAGLPIREVSWRCPRRELLASDEFLSRAGGVIILSKAGSPGDADQLLLYSTSSGETRPLAELPEPFGIYGSSPSRRWLLYDHLPRNETNDYEYGKGRFVVVDARGRLRATIEREDAWLDSFWLDDDRVLFELDNPLGGAEILNPFTGERQSLTPTLPGHYRPDRLYPGYWSAQYAPSLTHVAYPRLEENGIGVVLRDIEHGVDVWTWDRATAATLISPRWSPQGDTLAVAAMDSDTRLELYLVDLRGRATKWIDLLDYWGAQPTSLVWSPNGRYLTFGFLEDHPLLILDTQSLTLTAYCIPVHGSPLWSPSSTHLIVPRRGKPSWYMVLDVEAGRAANIGIGIYAVYENDRTSPVAWLREP